MRYTKQSLNKALSEAAAMSKAHPSIKYYVLDKKKSPAKCFSLGWAVSEHIRDKGYHIHSIYCDGHKI